MARYTSIFGSEYPNDIITVTEYKNADNTIGQLLNQIKQAEESGNYSEAQSIIRANANVLKQYVMDSSAINRYQEEIRNIEIFVKANKQQIFYQTSEPRSYASVGDVWILEGTAI